MTPQQLFDKLSAMEQEANMPNADRYMILKYLKSSLRGNILFGQLVREALIDPNKPDIQPLFNVGDIGALMAALKEKFNIDD